MQRLATEHPDKRITFLDKTVCFCSTMNRIDLPHFNTKEFFAKLKTRVLARFDAMLAEEALD